MGTAPGPAIRIVASDIAERARAPGRGHAVLKSRGKGRKRALIEPELSEAALRESQDQRRWSGYPFSVRNVRLDVREPSARIGGRVGQLQHEAAGARQGGESAEHERWNAIELNLGVPGRGKVEPDQPALSVLLCRRGGEAVSDRRIDAHAIGRQVWVGD